jgi:predicted metalloprotease with PDZ domain
MKKNAIIIVAVIFLSLGSRAEKFPGTMFYTVSMPDPGSHYFHISLRCEGLRQDTISFKMPNWSPGYYQLLNYSKNVEHFNATGDDGKDINFQQASANNWRVVSKRGQIVSISYDVKATSTFVAQSFLDESHGYIIPAGVFLYIEGQLQRPVTVRIEPYKDWQTVATGLDIAPGRSNSFLAPDFDVLYDSPILIGNLEELPSFTVDGKPHRFIGYRMGNFDRVQFMADLKKIVEGGSAVIGDIPYRHYTFLAIGPGRGGIEHLNSTTISFDGSQLNTADGKRRMYSFLAHEYFHHYNVKRIRPIELGPFDYDKGSRTNQLWISEGLSVYYEYLILKRKGLMTRDEFFNALRNNIMNYENKPGHLYQTVAQASYDTWSDGPFGRTGDEVNKTISYYDKGPALGMLLDLKIRHETHNKRSLDDVMQTLYKKYYQEKKRGFTEEEFRAVTETIAGTPLPEFFGYVYTVKDPDYPTYLSYAGLKMDTATKEVPAPWLGISTRERDDSISINGVDWNSPAWNAGLRAGDRILAAEGRTMNKKALDELIKTKQKGDKIRLTVWQNNSSKETEIVFGKKYEKDFLIYPVPDPTPLQAAILSDWMRN